MDIGKLLDGDMMQYTIHFVRFVGICIPVGKTIEMKTEHGVRRYMHQKKNLITVQCVAKIWK